SGRPLRGRGLGRGGARWFRAKPGSIRTERGWIRPKSVRGAGGGSACGQDAGSVRTKQGAFLTSGDRDRKGAKCSSPCPLRSSREVVGNSRGGSLFSRGRGNPRGGRLTRTANGAQTPTLEGGLAPGCGGRRLTSADTASRERGP